METIIILSRKGGVGKTATAHALGAALMKRKKRVLFIDADGQSNLTLTMKGSEDNLSLYDVLNRESTIKRAIQETEGGYIIPGNEMLHAADMMLKGTDKNLILREALKEVSKQWTDKIPDGTKALANLLKEGIKDGSVDPFLRKIVSQDAVIRNDGKKVFSAEEILRMDWLCENVYGSIPSFDELSEKGQAITRLQGIYRDQIPPSKSSVQI